MSGYKRTNRSGQAKIKRRMVYWWERCDCDYFYGRWWRKLFGQRRWFADDDVKRCDLNDMHEWREIT